ncbi:MAG: integrase arm-type DNA-binding domain-containing protein [Fretibacterium sp.]|nr:integrase arm-type DNA-binding domain-containing protein [Fretibacterium sp.]
MKRKLLTEATAKKAKPGKKRYTLSDGEGFGLEVMPTGSKMWRLRYFVDGKRKLITMGEYSAMTFEEAHQKAEELRSKLQRPVSRVRTRKARQADTFHALVEKWISSQGTQWSAAYEKKIRQLLEAHLLPVFGEWKFGSITASELWTILRRVANDSGLETAEAACRIFGEIARFGMETGVCESDISSSLTDFFPAREQKLLSPVAEPETKQKSLKQLLEAVSKYRGKTPIVRAVLWFSLYTLCQPGEVRCAEWKEIDLEKGIWRMPEEKKAARKACFVPLSRQAAEMLKSLRLLTGGWKWVFPSFSRTNCPVNVLSIYQVLRMTDFAENESSPGSLRSLESAMLKNMGYGKDMIEAALSHVQPEAWGKSASGKKWEKQVEMMQAWADRLDELADEP